MSCYHSSLHHPPWPTLRRHLCPHFDEFSAQRQCQRLLVSLRAIDHQTSAEIRTKGRVCDWGNSRSPRLIGAIVYRSPWVTVEDAVRCLLGLPLLPVDIRPALVDVKETLADNNAFTSKLHDLIRHTLCTFFWSISSYSSITYYLQLCIKTCHWTRSQNVFITSFYSRQHFSSLPTVIKSSIRIQAIGLLQTIFTARAYARAVLGVVILSVCPSVCHTRGLWQN